MRFTAHHYSKSLRQPKQPSRFWVWWGYPFPKVRLSSCISYRITKVIHVIHHQINRNCCTEPFAVSLFVSLYRDMHGLIFETSIWLLARSTRFLYNETTSIRWVSLWTLREYSLVSVGLHNSAIQSALCWKLDWFDVTYHTKRDSA